MWRRSSISSVSSASRARRYSALSLGKRTLLARASSAAGFRAELLMASPHYSADLDGLRLQDDLRGDDPTGWRKFCDAPGRQIPRCRPPLLQLRRRGAVEHLALRAFEQVECVGLNRQRPAHALELRQLLH